MDPDANLAEQLRLARKLLTNETVFPETTALRLAELVVAMNDWIEGGGFIPAHWDL